MFYSRVTCSFWNSAAVEAILYSMHNEDCTHIYVISGNVTVVLRKISITLLFLVTKSFLLKVYPGGICTRSETVQCIPDILTNFFAGGPKFVATVNLTTILL